MLRMIEVKKTSPGFLKKPSVLRIFENLEEFTLVFIIEGFAFLFGQPILQQLLHHFAQTHFIASARVFHRLFPSGPVDQ